MRKFRVIVEKVTHLFTNVTAETPNDARKQTLVTLKNNDESGFIALDDSKKYRIAKITYTSSKDFDTIMGSEIVDIKPIRTEKDVKCFRCFDDEENVYYMSYKTLLKMYTGFKDMVFKINKTKKIKYLEVME